ncbi:DNA repair protein RAD50-like [Artemia franciscana]|uniref:DNA repair protein RAD50-like n=1 Tax=Artemia franciscana TaxID=6661 RepID=UPI0032DA33F0
MLKRGISAIKTNLQDKYKLLEGNPVKLQKLDHQMEKHKFVGADIKTQFLAIGKEQDVLPMKLPEIDKTDVDLKQIFSEKKQLTDDIASQTDHDIAKTQLAAALFEVSLLKATITRLETQNETLFRENERLANMEHQLNITLSENKSLKEDTARLKTENILLLQDVSVKDVFARSIRRENEELISKNDSRLKEAFFEVSSLKEEVTNLYIEIEVPEFCRILREEEESAKKYEEEISCLKSYVDYLQMKINELETTSESLKQEVGDKSCLSETSEKILINLTDKEDKTQNQTDELKTVRKKVLRIESAKHGPVVEKEDILTKMGYEIHSLKSEILECTTKNLELKEEITKKEKEFKKKIILGLI